MDAAEHRLCAGDPQPDDGPSLGGRDDHRISEDMLRGWEFHTSGAFTCTLFDGGHFYLNDHTDTVAELIGRG